MASARAGLEAPQVAVDEGGVGLVALADAVDDAGLLDPGGRTEGGAQVAEVGAEAFDGALRVGVGPQGVDGGVEGGALGP